MGKNLGTSATLLTLAAAFIFHISSNGSLEKSGGAAVQTTNKILVTQSPEPATSGAQTQSAASAQGSDTKDLKACALSAECQDRLQNYLGFKDSKLQFLIASVPDPERTRLSLFTDTAINAVQQAAFDAHWELATQWLPWRQSVAQGKMPTSLRKVFGGRDQPGFLVFRHSPIGNRFDNNVLLVFLVGETPTAGLNLEQFRTARAYMRAIGDPQNVRLVMPCFSGSIFSLTKLIESDRKTFGSRPHHYSIRSGSATDRRLVGAFRGLEDVDIYGTNLNNADEEKDFVQVLASLRIPANESAVLIEDESAYSKNVSEVSNIGQSYSPEDATSESSRSVEHPLILRYPRDISNLRNHYKEIGEGTNAEKATQDVDFSLKDLDAGDDSLPIFSSEKTPVEQDAILNEITAQIRRDRIHLVKVSATNVLDLIFLARVLRAHCPDTRVLVTSPDLLFLKESQESSLTGILALSPYPLFFAASHWLGERPMTHSNANEEGLYYAAKLLLLSPDQKDSFDGYAWKGQLFPASWLMSLTHQGFTPLRLIKNANGDANEANWFNTSKSTREATFVLFHPPSSWMISLSLLSLFSLAICGWIIYLDRNLQAASLDILAPDGNHIADAHRLLCVVSVLLLLATMQCLLIMPLGTLCFTLPYIALTFCALNPVVLSFWLVPKILRKPRCSRARYIIVAAVFLLPALIVIQWARCCYRSLDQIGFFFSFRSLEMQTGSSPVLPVLFLLAALLTFAFGHLIRFYFAINHRPRMFVATMDHFFSFKMRNCRRDLNRVLVAPMNLSPRRQLALGGVFGIAVLLLLALWRGGRKLSSLEGIEYDLLLLSLVAAVSIVILVTTLQLKLAWGALHPLLTRLHALPLRSAFTRISDGGKTGPIWARRLNMHSLTIPIRSLALLHNLEVSASRGSWNYGVSCGTIAQCHQKYGEILCGLLENSRITSRKPDSRTNAAFCAIDSRSHKRQLFCSLRYLGAILSHTVAEQVLVPEWQGRMLPAEGLNESTDNIPASAPADAYQLSQTFVALQFSAFINYAVRQIQNLIFAISLAFGLLVVALNLYQAQAPQSINRLLLIAFAVLGYSIWAVLSQMERDPILSQLSGTAEGVLNKEFYFKLIGYGAVPALGLLTSQFPAIGNFVSSWLEPSLEALR